MGWFFGLFGGKKEKTSEEKKEPSVLDAVGLNKQTLADIGKVLGGQNALTVEEESKKAEHENQTETQVAAHENQTETPVAAPVIGIGLKARFALCAENITDENNPYQARDAARENVNPALLDNGMAYA